MASNPAFSLYPTSNLSVQISDDFLSRIEVLRGHTYGYLTFPWDFNMTLRSVEQGGRGRCPLHLHPRFYFPSQRSSDYCRHRQLAPSLGLLQQRCVFSLLDGIPRFIYRTRATEIDLIQFLIQPDNYTDGQVFGLQVTDAPQVLNIVATLKPPSLPLSYTSTELTLPVYRSGDDFKRTNQKTT